MTGKTLTDTMKDPAVKRITFAGPFSGPFFVGGSTYKKWEGSSKILTFLF